MCIENVLRWEKGSDTNYPDVLIFGVGGIVFAKEYEDLAFKSQLSYRFGRAKPYEVG